MKAINLIWIMPLCIIFGWFLAMNFVSADIDITMDDNTKEAILSLNNTLDKPFGYHLDYLQTELDKCKSFKSEMIGTYNNLSDSFWDLKLNYTLERYKRLKCEENIDWDSVE